MENIPPKKKKLFLGFAPRQPQPPPPKKQKQKRAEASWRLGTLPARHPQPGGALPVLRSPVRLRDGPPAPARASPEPASESELAREKPRRPSFPWEKRWASFFRLVEFKGDLGPHMAVFFRSYAFDRKKMAIRIFTFFSTTCRKNMGFIRVIYANDRKIMAIRANTAKYGSLTEKKTAIRGARDPSQRKGTKKVSFCHLWQNDGPPCSEAFVEGVANFLTKGGKKNPVPGTGATQLGAQHSSWCPFKSSIQKEYQLRQQNKGRHLPTLGMRLQGTDCFCCTPNLKLNRTRSKKQPTKT